MPSLNKYDGLQRADDVVSIGTGDDSNDVSGGAIRGISFAVAGALKVTTTGGQTVTITSGALSAGIIHPIGIVRVFSTGTTATGIWGYR